MRNRIRAAAALAAAAATLVLAACGDDDTGTAAESSTAAADAAAFPVTIEHKFGTTEIPEPPERVVTIGFNEHDFALALGVQPVGAREFIGEYAYKTRPWAQEALAGSDPQVVGAEELNFERIAALRPDLILGVYSFIDESAYRRLEKIAPTVAQSDRYADGAVPWDEQLRATGQALGREEQAEEVVADVEARIERAREEHPEFRGKTAAIVYATGNQPFILTPEDLRTQFFTALGFEPPAKTGEISREQMRLLDQNVIVLASESGATLADDPLFRRLDAVKEGRVIEIDFADHFAGALGFNSPLSIPFLLDEAAPRLAAAVDGDPQTQVEQAR